jgi:hypothetical protein
MRQAGGRNLAIDTCLALQIFRRRIPGGIDRQANIHFCEVNLHFERDEAFNIV